MSDQNPVVTDTIQFSFPTTDANDCIIDPYKMDSVIIYFIERDFASKNENQYNAVVYQADKLAALEEAKKEACLDSSKMAVVIRLQAELDASSLNTPFYYTEARPVKIIGSKDFPAWLSTDQNNALINRLDIGQFQYNWDTNGAREGDYFVCWTWTPNPAGDSLSQHLKFNLSGNTAVTTSIPSHYTQATKYYDILTKYTPEMFKMQLMSIDRTPDILDKLNKSIASGFTLTEDLVNQVVDLQDANSTHETFLPLLAKYFGLKLKTNDPTLWRRQIKQAIPLLKKKGTRSGLEEALAQAGISLIKLNKLWQVKSASTYEESFVYSGTSAWQLAKSAYPIDLSNFGLWLRPAGEDTYISLSQDYVEFTNMDGVTTMTWVGDQLDTDPIDLVDHDIIRILYLYNSVEDQSIENYIRSLPLADQRDERDQDYPLKNWNIHLLEDDDPLFNVVIKDRHPHHEFLVYGKVRTIFPYSENAYNKEEYNGSIRNSKLPCDIDKDFLDPCTACLSSKFNIYLEIETLTNDRIQEAIDVIREFSPFHAVLNTMSFIGRVTEFMLPPMEEIDTLVNVTGQEYFIGGQGQMWFNRAMKRGTTTAIINRSMLASTDVPVSGMSGVAYNDNITIFSSDVNFEDLGMASPAILEILAPSPSAGIYDVSSPFRHTAVVDSVTEPINTSGFTFRISNTLTDGSICNIDQDNIFLLSDTNNIFSTVLSSFDVDHNDATSPYSVTITAYSATPYIIKNVYPDGTLELQDNSFTLQDGIITYILMDENDQVVLASDTGNITKKNRAIVTALDSSVQDINNLIRDNCYILISGNQYIINGVISESQFYIFDYTLGSMASVTMTIYQRLVDNKIGYLSHRGMKLQASSNLESILNIQNGTNSVAIPLENDNFMENFVITINDQDYLISNIDGNIITLNGPDNYWQTSGTSITFDVTHFTKESITVPGQQFDLPEHTFRTYDRDGREVITRQTNTDSPVSTPFRDFISQNENVDFKIEWLDGTSEEGSI